MGTANAHRKASYSVTKAPDKDANDVPIGHMDLSFGGTVCPTVPAPYGLTLPTPGCVHLWIGTDPQPVAPNARQPRTTRLARRYLEVLLERYLGEPITPNSVVRTALGKPYVVGSSAAQATKLRFNISHSANVFAIAFGWDTEIGVDIEMFRSGADRGGIVARFFSDGERALWGSLREQEQRGKTFHRIWTRKEAALKALGIGLSRLQLDFDVLAERTMVGEQCLWLASSEQSDSFVYSVASTSRLEQLTVFNGAGS